MILNWSQVLEREGETVSNFTALQSLSWRMKQSAAWLIMWQELLI